VNGSAAFRCKRPAQLPFANLRVLNSTTALREIKACVNLAIDLNALATAPAQPGVGSIQFEGMNLNLFAFDAASRADLL